MSEKRRVVRTRNFATVVYPDSAPEDWKNRLAEHKVQAFVSPLHDLDINPGGERKKPHFHVMFMFESVKTSEQAKAIFDTFGGVGCEIINGIRGYARYLCHLDNPEKAQYDPKDVLSYFGANYEEIIGLYSDKYKAVGEMMDFCIENGIFSYAQLIIYARHSNENWFRALCDNSTIVMKEFLKSYFWTEKNIKADDDDD